MDDVRDIRKNLKSRYSQGAQNRYYEAPNLYDRWYDECVE